MHALFFLKSFPNSPEAFQHGNLCTCVAAALTGSVMSITCVSESSLMLESTTHRSPRPTWHLLSGMSPK